MLHDNILILMLLAGLKTVVTSSVFTLYKENRCKIYQIYHIYIISITLFTKSLLVHILKKYYFMYKREFSNKFVTK